MMPQSENPLISIIVAVYNVEPYLRCCLDSIINQTYNKLEILVVTTPSSDKSEEIAREYEASDERVQVIIRPKLGLSDARNAGIAASHGEYLAFIDGDDYISEYYVERLYTLIKDGCDISQCGFKYVDAKDTNIVNDFSNDSSVYSNIEASANLLNQSNTANVVTWSKLYAKHLFTTVTFPLGKLHEDVATTYRLLYIAKKVAVTSDQLYYYRQVPGSIMGQGYSLKRLDVWDFRLECLKFYQERSETYLYARALCVYLKWVGSTYHDLQISVPDSDNLRKKLIAEGREHLKIALKEKDVSVAEKGLFVMICYCPRLVSVLVGWKRKLTPPPS